MCCVCTNAILNGSPNIRYVSFYTIRKNRTRTAYTDFAFVCVASKQQQQQQYGIDKGNNNSSRHTKDIYS